MVNKKGYREVLNADGSVKHYRVDITLGGKRITPVCESEEIAKATEEVFKIKKNRNQSISRMHLHKLQDAVESAKRKVKRIIPKLS